MSEISQIDTEIAPIRDFSDPFHDPFNVNEAAFGEVEDLHGQISELRKTGEVQAGAPATLFGAGERFVDPSIQYFTVLGYHELKEVAGDPQRFSQQCQQTMLGLTMGKTLSVMDPPEHSNVRKVFQKVFLPRTLSRWGDTIILPTINSLIDGFADRGRVDFIEEFTKRYPFDIIFRQLDLPGRDVHTFHKLATSLIQMNGDLLTHALEASANLGAYFKEMVDYRRQTAGDDLVSYLVHAEVDGESIPEEIIISFLRQLMAAAADTTFRSTGTLIMGLVGNPDQLADVTRDRSLVPAAVDEALRWNGPNTFSPRAVMEDTEVAGVAMPKGSIVYFSEVAANRDPRVFENPHAFNIHRERHRNMAFSYGPHVCLGQHLARMEMEVALNAVLDRLPNMRFDPDKPSPSINGLTFRSPKDIYLLFDV